MYGKKVKLRLLFLSFIFIIVALSVFLILKSLEENVVYFISPTEIKNLSEIDKNKRIRVGGMVKEKSIKLDQSEINFIITVFCIKRKTLFCFWSIACLNYIFLLIRLYVQHICKFY